jgi:hypothetical protein
MPAMTNAKAIDFMRKHVNAFDVSCPEAHKRVLHLAECWIMFRKWAECGAPGYKIDSADLVKKIVSLESPPPPDPKDELRKALDELSAFIGGDQHLWPSFPSYVQVAPILDKITELRKRLGVEP